MLNTAADDIIVSFMTTCSQAVTSSLLVPNAFVGGSAVPARDGDILSVGDKRFRCVEQDFTGNRVDGFHDTSLQSNMMCDVYELTSQVIIVVVTMLTVSLQTA